MTEQPTSTSPPRSFAVNLLFVLAATTVVLAGMRSMRDIVGTVFLALVLTITVHPIRTWLESRRLPEWAASILTLLGTYLILVGLALALVVSVAQMASLVQEYTPKIQEHVADLGSQLHSLGVDQKQIDTLAKAVDPGKLVSFISGILGDLAGVLGSLFFLLLVLLFTTFDTNSTRRGSPPSRHGRPAPWPRSVSSPGARGTTWASRRSSA